MAQEDESMTAEMSWMLKASLLLERTLPWRIASRFDERNTQALRDLYMARAVDTRPYPTGSDAPSFELHALLGHRHVGMCLWSVKSFLHCAGRKYHVVLHDDGTLSQSDRQLLEEHLPQVTIITRQDADAIMREKLANYPNATEYRFTKLETSNHRGVNYDMFIMALILFDLNLVTNAKKIMIMDIDVLFFRKPSEILHWIEDPEDRHTLYSVEAYKPYFDQNGVRQYTAKVAKTLNSGLLCINKDTLYNLDEIELWISENKDLMYTSSNFEQLCYSFLIKRHPDSVALPYDTYSFNYTDSESVATHFGIKRMFFENIARIEPELMGG